MFTGIIEEVGRLESVKRQGETLLVHLAASVVTSDVKLGDSIAVNGVCLTVVSFTERAFSADVMPETFRSTNLHELKIGDPVNLERAMSGNDRFGGHLVQGHVDGVGLILERKREQNAEVYRIKPDHPELFRTIIPKGSIAIDGISLTVVEADGETLTVSIIPHTLEQTVLQYKQPGSRVNLETDVIGKYVAHLLQFETAGTANPLTKRGLTESLLREHGFA